MGYSIPSSIEETWRRSHADWNFFAEYVLGVHLDDEQKKILSAVQYNSRVSARSGNARGKDYVAAVAAICWVYLYKPSKVILTAPTGRQVISIMMSEIKGIHKGAKVSLGGRVLNEKILFEDEPDHFLLGFKASDTEDEAWTGFHSQNLMVIVTEASGIDDNTFDNIDRILPGDSRLLIVYNPNRLTGEAARSIKDPRYKSFRLNCLDAPNVKAKKILIPGQVDWKWVNDQVTKPGRCTKIDKSEVREDLHDFEWEGQWYRPGDLCRIMVLGEFPLEDENVLIPRSWVVMSNERWVACGGKSENGDALKLGVDVAGMGRDKTSFVFRRGNVVEKIKRFSKSDHMSTVGRIINELKEQGDTAYIDSIGEGAGVFSRAVEVNREKRLRLNIISSKFSFADKTLTDYTGEMTFANMRAYCYWAVRDALNPAYDEQLALPPDDDLMQDLTEPTWNYKSNGDIIIEPKEDIKERLGRSPDDGDAVALTYFRGAKRPQVRML